MTTIESVVLWLSFAMLAWICLSLVGVYDTIRKILINQIEMKSRMESIQSGVWDASGINKRAIDDLRERLLGDDD